MNRSRFVLAGRNEQSGGLQYFCFDFDVKYNRHGNIEVEVDKELVLSGVNASPSFVPFFRSSKYVFNRDGVCISHLPGKRYRYSRVNAELVESHT